MSCVKINILKYNKKKTSSRPMFWLSDRMDTTSRIKNNTKIPKSGLI